MGVWIANKLYPMDDIGCGPAEMAANPRKAVRRKTIDRCHHPETIMRLVGDEEANKIRMTGGFVRIEKRVFTRVFYPFALNKMINNPYFNNRKYLVKANVKEDWKRTIISHDGPFSMTVDVPDINQYLMSPIEVIPLRR